MGKKEGVAVILAFRMMQEIYSPLMKFYKEMFRNDCDDYCALTMKFVLVGHDKVIDKDLDFFENVNMSFTINKVSKNIVSLRNKYEKKVTDDVYFGALVKIFDCLRRDIMKWTDNNTL